MKSVVIILSLIIPLFIQYSAFAFETAPRISDTEIVERLTRLEEGQKAILRELDKRFEAVDKRFEAVDKRFESIDKRFESVDAQLKQFRDDMNAQFDRMTNIFFGILAAFVAMFGGTIWFALWDRKTMVRPFEDKVKKIEDDIAKNKGSLHSLIESFRALGATDEKVAAVLKKFNLL